MSIRLLGKKACGYREYRDCHIVTSVNGVKNQKSCARMLMQTKVSTAPELAERFEVSRRTINRDIEDLCKAGIPIKTAQGTGGGISIMDGYRMDRTILSSKDMQMILAGLRSLDSVSGSRYYSQLMEEKS